MQSIADFYDTYEQLSRFRVMIIINANTLAAEIEGEDRTTRLFRKLEARAKVLLGSGLTAAELKEYLENATVCVDEVDKISGRISGKANVEGITTQYALLTLLEGEQFLYRTTLLQDGQEVEVDLPLDTGKLLFICGGAFEELYDQVYSTLVNRRDDRRLKEVSEVERKADGSVSVRTVARFKLRDYLRLADLFVYGMVHPSAAGAGLWRAAPVRLGVLGYSPFFFSIKEMASWTFWINWASSSEISTLNSSSMAIISSVRSRESAPRSSTNLASGTTSPASTPS